MNMNNVALPQGALYEHRFWLQILGDHSRFILNTLSPLEKEDIAKAEAFIVTFDRLLDAARQASTEAQAAELTRQAYQPTLALRAFKLDILRRLLLGKIKIMLTPTFVNHMVNELEEYVRVLEGLAATGKVPEFDPLHHDLLWLPDASGHASAIASDLDAVEKSLIAKSQAFAKHFDALHLKAIEMCGYMRTQLRDFPAFRRFHTDIDVEIKLFVAFLCELEQMELTAEVLDRISPLIPDHMMREECYYLTKLALSGLVPPPGCDAASLRIES